MINTQTQPANKGTNPGYSWDCHPVVRPIYGVIDAASYLIGSIIPAQTEEAHREHLRELSQRVKAREDKSNLPSLTDMLLDAAEHIIRIDEPESPGNPPKSQAA